MVFLEPENVCDYFNNELMPTMTEDDLLRQFSCYILNTYILFADFPPNIWASTSSTLTWTTNACESFHSHFNKSFYTLHPHIYNFMDELKSEIYIKINSINEPYKFQNTKSKKKFQKKEKIIQQYNENTTTRAEYVKMMPHYYSLLFR